MSNLRKGKPLFQSGDPVKRLLSKFSNTVRNSLYGRSEGIDQRKYKKAAKPFYKESEFGAGGYYKKANVSQKVSDIQGDFNTKGKSIKNKPTEYSYKKDWESPQHGVTVTGSSHTRTGSSMHQSVTNNRGDKFKDVSTDRGMFTENTINTPEGKIINRQMGRGKDAIFGSQYPKMGNLPARTFSYTSGGKKFGKSKAPSDLNFMDLLRMNFKR